MPLSLLHKSTSFTLNQLKEVLGLTSNDNYTAYLPILSNSSIGMHVRHILEFYECLLQGLASNSTVNYDNRKRNLNIETDIAFAIEILDSILLIINDIKEDQIIQVDFNLDLNSNQLHATSSSTSRELCYLIEHTIHHMAIIKMAYLHAFPNYCLPKGFGVAYSTIKFNNSNVHSNVLANK